MPARLAVLVGAIVLVSSVGLGLAVGVLASEEVLEREATRQLALATDLQRVVEEDLLERRRDVQLIAGALGDGDLDERIAPLRRLELERTLETALSGPTPISWIGLVDAFGTVQHTSGLRPQGEVLPIGTWVEDGQADRPTVSGTHHLPLSERLPDQEGLPLRIADVAAPVTDPAGRMVGVVVEYLPAAWLLERRDARLSLDRETDMHVLFLDHHDQLLLPANRRMEPLAGITDRVSGQAPELGGPDQVLVQQGTEARAALHQVEGGQDLLVAQQLSTNPELLGWRVVVVRPADAVLAGVRQVQLNMLLFGLAAGTLTALAAALAVRRSSRGLRAIDRAAHAIREGDAHAEMPLVEGRDDIASVSRSLRDLTDHLIERRAELERTEAQLRAALASQDEFVAMASHEMRTPLTVVRGSLEVLDARGDRLSHGQREDLLRAADRQLDRLERLANNLLLTQALQVDGALEPHLAPTDLFRPAELLLGLLRGEYLLVGETQLRVRGNSTLLELTVGNLVDNAGRYGRPPVEVAFAVTGAEGHTVLEVAVTDHGQGVPPAFEPHLFGRFSQASQGLTRTPGGTGLGLWLSRQLLEAIGGELVYRRADHGGAVFTVSLPVQVVAEPAPTAGVMASGVQG